VSILLLSNVGLLRKGFAIGGTGSLLAGTFLFSIFGVVYKSAMSAGISPASLLIVQSPLVLLTSSFINLKGGTLKVDETVLKHAPWCGILLFISQLLLLFSLQWGEASVNVPIVHLSFVVTSALAVLLLGERLTPRKMVGIALAALTVAVFSL
jgi:transporter family protein